MAKHRHLDTLKPKILTKRKDQKQFLAILNGDKAEGYISRACKEFGCGVRTVQRRMAEDIQFRDKINAIKEGYRIKRLDALETVSHVAALDPKNYRERKFQLEALDPEKYRPNFTGYGNAPIQINFGFNVPAGMMNPKKVLTPSKNITPNNPENLIEVIVVPDDGIEEMDYEI